MARHGWPRAHRVIGVVEVARHCLVRDVNEGQEPLGVIGDYDELILWVVGELVGPELSSRIGLDRLDQRSCAVLGVGCSTLIVLSPSPTHTRPASSVSTPSGPEQVLPPPRAARRRNPPNEDALADVAQECIGLSVNEIDRLVGPIGEEVFAGRIFNAADVETGGTRWIDRLCEGDRIVAGRSQTRAHHEKN